MAWEEEIRLALGGTVAVANSEVVAAKGRYWARASPAAILSGFGSRDMVGSWATAGRMGGGLMRQKNREPISAPLRLDDVVAPGGELGL